MNTIPNSYQNSVFPVTPRVASSSWILLGSLALLLMGCDTDIAGDPFANQPPNTSLSVRDSSLVDNIESGNRFTSTVFISWSGTDPDGYISGFDIRFYDRSESPAPDAGWSRTTANDTLILLPIPSGSSIADVTFEARAVDNEGALDPTPATTVFPIQNSPPTLRFNRFDLPADTTFPVFSFAWVADDPEGLANLSRIEVSLNDSMSFVALPPDVAFATFLGNFDVDPLAEQEAEVYVGRSFQRTGIRVPGLRPGETNTFYVRAIDQTDTSSVRLDYSWFVKAKRADILYVDDFRKSTSPTVKAFHMDLLRSYLPPDTPIDTWDIRLPFVTGSSGNAPRSSLLPANADPTLRQTLARYRHIYWVATASTNSVTGNNLPFSANVMDLFFENGGTIMVHSPITLPQNPEENLGNAAVLLLPLTDLVSFPDSLRSSLRLTTGTELRVAGSLPGISTPLPTLQTSGFLIGTLPYIAASNNIVPLYQTDFEYRTRQGNRRGTWPESFGNVIASISSDGRVGLFSLPLVNETTGAPTIEGSDGDENAIIEAIHLMLESLGFPQ